jgi:heme A synthase
VDNQTGRVVPIPWLAAFTLWLLAIALFVWALLARPRLKRKPGHRPLAPIVAARTAALAMAASRTGSLVAGFYAGICIGTIPSRATEAGTSTLWTSLASAAGAVALTAAALWLEHICRLPTDGDTKDSGLGRVSA